MIYPLKSEALSVFLELRVVEEEDELGEFKVTAFLDSKYCSYLEVVFFLGYYLIVNSELVYDLYLSKFNGLESELYFSITIDFSSLGE